MSTTEIGDRSAYRDLQMLGLGGLAIQVYAELTLNASASLETLPEELRRPQDEVDEAVRELSLLGLLVRSVESERLRAVAPRVALNRLLEARDLSLREEQGRIALARAAAEHLIDEAAVLEDHRRASLEILSGRDLASDRIAELIRQAETEVLTMITSLPSPEALAQARAGDLALLARGVRTRMLVLAGHLRRSRELVEHIEVLVAHGAQVRVGTVLPTRMIVVDGKVAVVPIDPHDPTLGATLLRQTSLIALTLDAFERAWNDAAEPGEVTIVSPRSVSAWEPNSIEMRVIQLLGAGNKDEAVARRMGMSLRSVRRIIATISEQLGSDSRFELGARCSALGWVNEDSTPPQRTAARDS